MKNGKSLSQIIPDESDQNARMIRRVVKIGCVVNAFLMVMKLAVGYFGHSDALMADGFHSLTDMAADLVMLIFVGISYRAADERFSYGYGKFETFSSFLISTFLIVVAVMIGWEAVESIVAYARGEILPQPDIWTIFAVLFAMACKEGLFRFYSRVGRKVDSKALITNAWHHRSDALSSVAVLIGVTFSYFFGSAFRILDPVASLIIALLILVAAFRLFIPAFFELMERSLPNTDVEKAREAVSATPGVEDIISLRTRRNGHHLIFDIGIRVNSKLTMREANDICEDVKKRLMEAFCRHIVLSITPFV